MRPSTLALSLARSPNPLALNPPALNPLAPQLPNRHLPSQRVDRSPLRRGRLAQLLLAHRIAERAAAATSSPPRLRRERLVAFRRDALECGGERTDDRSLLLGGDGELGRAARHQRARAASSAASRAEGGRRAQREGAQSLLGARAICARAATARPFRGSGRPAAGGGTHLSQRGPRARPAAPQSPLRRSAAAAAAM
eukprot:3936385-Prymnesium_polylepis.1